MQRIFENIEVLHCLDNKNTSATKNIKNGKQCITAFYKHSTFHYVIMFPT